MSFAQDIVKELDVVLPKKAYNEHPNGDSKIINGVSTARRISISDSQMRHNRKSSSCTINGFKQHIAIDLDHKLILATRVRPANELEHV